MRIINCKQGEDEWFTVRRGIPTASEFGRIITPAKGDYAKGAETYMNELVAELLGWSEPDFSNRHTERGNRIEPIARDWLAFDAGCDIKEVGFILSDCGRYGGSPDGLIDGEIPLEIKSVDLPKFIEWRRNWKLPDEHKCQVHGHMLLTGASHCTFLAYPDHPDLDPLVLQVQRDAFTSTVETHVKTFVERLEVLQREILGENFEKYVKR